MTINYHELRMDVVNRLQQAFDFRDIDNPRFSNHNPTDDKCGCKLCSIQRKLVSTVAGDSGIGIGWLANELLDTFRFITIDTSDELYIYDEGIYEPLGEQVIKHVCQRIHQGISSYRVNEIIRRIKRETIVSREIFESRPYLLACENGTLDLSNIETSDAVFTDHSPNNFLLTKIPVRYDPEATAELFNTWIREVAYPEDIPVIEEMLGFCLRREYWLHKSFAFVGETHSGKSTLLGVMKAFLGRHNVTGMTIQQIVENRFHAARLYGKLANLAPDMPNKGLIDTGVFKAATGEDYITVEKKGKDGFEILNYAKFFFSANSLPESENDRSDAFYSRFRILRFDKRFLENPDTTLPRRLTTPTELSGLLNIAICGLRRLLTQGKFTNDPTPAEARIDWLKRSDPIGWMAEVLIEEDATGWIEKRMFNEVYFAACKLVGKPPKSGKGITQSLSNIFPSMDETHRVKVGDKRFYVYRGISFKNYLEVVDAVVDLPNIFCTLGKTRGINCYKERKNKSGISAMASADEIRKVIFDTIIRFHGQVIHEKELYNRLLLVFKEDDINAVLDSELELGHLKIISNHFMIGDTPEIVGGERTEY